MFDVIVARRARKSSKKLPVDFRGKIVELLLMLRENPVPAEYYDVKKLKGFADTFRVRIGDLRVIYEISWDKCEIRIFYVGFREGAYS